jgi:uncharacterized membrane protein
MKEKINEIEKLLMENNQIGMSAQSEPIHWNLHNAIDAVLSALEEIEQENQNLKERLRRVEKHLQQSQ